MQVFVIDIEVHPYDVINRTPSRELQEHLWVFPMDYPIKLIGDAGDELRHGGDRNFSEALP